MEFATLKKSLNRMISRMVENVFFWITVVPVISGMSCTIYLRTLMTGTTIDSKKHCKIEFGAYAEAYVKPYHATPRNPVYNQLSALDQ